ncbi:hypothetical protein AB0D63_17975 [Kitasatospora sp. NPDC048343]|uniref:hypothetical protein n=1 Tax=Kitasatospora sp. NPDC048343 TaxID=3154717 RepID=UPI00340878B2
MLVAALAGALLGVLAGGGGYLLTRHEGGSKPTGAATLTGTPPVTASGSPSSSPTASKSPSATPSPTPTTPAPAPTPTGLHLNRVQDPNGFTLLVPDGWQRDEANNSTFYRSPDKASLIQVFAMSDKPPYEEATATEVDLTKLPGYHRIRLEQTAGGTAELEYAYAHAASGTVRHVVDHILVGPNGAAYAVIVAGPEGDWPTLFQALRDAELTGFCFTAQCPAATG